MDFSVLVVIQQFHSASSCPNRKDGPFGDKICNSPWLVNQFATVVKEFAKQQVESSAGFVFSEDLPQHSLGVFRCFCVFRTKSDMVFKADILPTDDFFERQVSCASPTHPFPRQLQRRSDIGYSIDNIPSLTASSGYIIYGYRYWKRSALRYIMSL